MRNVEMIQKAISTEEMRIVDLNKNLTKLTSKYYDMLIKHRNEEELIEIEINKIKESLSSGMDYINKCKMEILEITNTFQN